MNPPHPSFWSLLFLTLGAYAAGTMAYRRFKQHPAAHPVLVSLALIIAALVLSGAGFERYREANQLLSLWMGPATVALAVPLHRMCVQAGPLLVRLLPLTGMAAVGACTLTAAACAVMALPMADLWSLSMKTTSVPFALGAAGVMRSSTEWTVFAVFCTGIPTAVAGPWVMARLGIRDPRVIGLTLGITGHAFGVARATELGEEAVGFASFGMVLTGCLLSFLIPLAHHAWAG
jgi:putative effector of murein hydrolase